MSTDAQKIDIATRYGLDNADIAMSACREVGLPFFAACALLEQESGGKNDFGHDEDGVLSGYTRGVAEESFWAFYWEVTRHKQKSNGVGPCQITYAGEPVGGDPSLPLDGGYFNQMLRAGLKPWVPRDNMVFGFRLLKGFFDSSGSWYGAGRRYHGGDEAEQDRYGRELAVRVSTWRSRII